jgi:hypothetical protein
MTDIDSPPYKGAVYVCVCVSLATRDLYGFASDTGQHPTLCILPLPAMKFILQFSCDRLSSSCLELASRVERSLISWREQ